MEQDMKSPAEGVILMKSHGPHPERRVVIFNVWNEQRLDHGARCWAAVTREVNAHNSWKTREVTRLFFLKVGKSFKRNFFSEYFMEFSV